MHHIGFNFPLRVSPDFDPHGKSIEICTRAAAAREAFGPDFLAAQGIRRGIHGAWHGVNFTFADDDAPGAAEQHLRLVHEFMSRHFPDLRHLLP